MATDYGKDTLCVDSLQTGSLVSGARLIAQRLYHALTTPRGSLRGSEQDLMWGDDLTALIGAATSSSAAQIKAKVARAASLDEQIRDCRCDVSGSTSSGTTTYTVSIVATTATGPFALTLSVGETTVSLLGLSAS